MVHHLGLYVSLGQSTRNAHQKVFGQAGLLLAWGALFFKGTRLSGDDSYWVLGILFGRT